MIKKLLYVSLGVIFMALFIELLPDYLKDFSYYSKHMNMTSLDRSVHIDFASKSLIKLLLVTVSVHCFYKGILEYFETKKKF